MHFYFEIFVIFPIIRTDVYGLNLKNISIVVSLNIINKGKIDEFYSQIQHLKLENHTVIEERVHEKNFTICIFFIRICW